MANLVQNLSGEEETFYLDSMDLFRPGLKQIGKSIVEIKTHYMCSDAINIVPNNYTPQLVGVREAMLKHLENDSCFLYKYSVVTGSLISLSAELKKRFPGFVVLMDSLSLAIDFEISPRPNDVQCDVLLAICGQPVIVLTLVDGDKDSEGVTMYNTSVARGVTSTLRRFMDESVNVVFGVMCRSYLDTVDTFQTSIQAIAKDSSLFVTLSALETSPSRYEKIVTAFWAGVAETRSVISRDGRVDTDYLRFLTKDQCIILMENINNREVEVQSQPRTGATTLMLEVARRLSKLDKTLLLCRSQKEKKRLCSLYETTVIPDELCRIDLSSFKNVVDETGMAKPSTSGRLWTFSRAEECHDKGNDSEQTAAMKIEPESKDIGLEPNYSTKLEDVIKVFKDIKLKSSAVLSKQSTWKEEEFNLGTMDFWAGVAETRSVISRDGRVDTDYLRFLTKDQCIILMENINNRKVEVQFQPGSGATTLMLEVAWRLSKLEATLLVCRTKDKNRLGSVFSNITTEADLSDLSTYTNIVYETGAVSGQPRGRFWRFTKYVNPEIEELQNRVKMYEKDNANKEKMIHLLSSVDRQQKMHHLSTETETLKLLDVILRDLLSAYDLSSSLTQDVKAVKQNFSGEGHTDQKTKDYVRHVLDQLKLGIQGRKDVFPLLGNVTRRVKNDIRELCMKIEYMSMCYQPELTDTKNQREIAEEQNHPTRGDNKYWMDTDEQYNIETTQSPFTDLEQHSSMLSGGRPEVSQSVADGKRDITDSEKIAELRMTLATLETEADNKSKELMDLDEATEHGVEWEYNMDCLSQDIASMKIQDVIYDAIGVDEIPVTASKMIQLNASPAIDDVSGAKRRDTRRCLVHQLSHLQYGELTQRRLLGIVRDVNTDDLGRLSSLKAQSDCLERECPLYVVGKKRGKHSGFVACPPMTLDRERVSEDLAVSEDGLELVNTRGSLDQGTDRLKEYYGTCSRQPIPLPLSPSTLTVTRYWETHSRVQVKEPVSMWILEMGLTREEEVDWDPSWSVNVVGCDKHRGHICTRVLEGDSQVSNCLTDTMSPTPGTDVTLIHGAVLDMVRGRLAFIDVNRGRVLHKFDLDIRESLFPMFSTAPFKDTQCDVAMRLVSGREIAMTDEKKSLIATALYSQ